MSSGAVKTLARQDSRHQNRLISVDNGHYHSQLANFSRLEGVNRPKALNEAVAELLAVAEAREARVLVCVR